jgi:hypothetical protein
MDQSTNQKFFANGKNLLGYHANPENKSVGS